MLLSVPPLPPRNRRQTHTELEALCYLEPAPTNVLSRQHADVAMRVASIDNPAYESIDLPVSGLERCTSTRPAQHEVVQEDRLDLSQFN